MTLIQPLGTLSSIASLLAAILYQGNHAMKRLHIVVCD